MVVLKHIKSQVVSLQAFAPIVSDETAYVINRMMNKDPEERYPSYEELLTHLRYARQRLQKKNAEPGGATARPAAKAGSNLAFLTMLWSAVALLGAAFAFWICGSHGALAGARSNPSRVADGQAMVLVEAGRQALQSGHFAEAREKFDAALGVTGDLQPERDWMLAQSGLASTLLRDDAAARDTFAKLGNSALFDLALAPQAPGAVLTCWLEA